MGTLLRIDSSADTANSVSSALTGTFAAHWERLNPGLRIRYRNLGDNPVPVVGADWLAGTRAPRGADLAAPARAALELSDTLVDELFEADWLVFGVPVYNHSVPSSFKAWIDQVFRMGRTVVPGPAGLKGQLGGRRALIISTRAGDYRQAGPGVPVGSRADWDFHEPYLRKLFSALGVDDLEYLPVMTSRRPEVQSAAIQGAEERLRRIADRWRSVEEPETLRLLA